ncbi:protein of unknown function [Streptomyces murinus]
MLCIAAYWTVLGCRSKRDSYPLFALPIERQSAHLVNLEWTDSEKGSHPHPFRPSGSMPWIIGPLRPKYRRHRARTGLPSRPERAADAGAQIVRYAPRVTRHIRSAR